MRKLRLSENLAGLRRKKGITQEVVADFLGVTKASVSKWETGLSMPDITQLPKLASYYDVTIDELMGYEAQISMEQIKEQYVKFVEAFAREPFEKVMGEVQEFIRQYYSCYEALIQMVVLLLNHYMITEEARQKEILGEMILICEHVRERSTDVSLCTDAMVLQSMAELLLGKPEKTIEKLKVYQNPGRIGDDLGEVLIQAYQMTGQMDEASEWNQVLIWRHLICLVENSSLYLMSNLMQKECGLETIRRVNGVMKQYNAEQIMTNSFLKFKYVEAMFYATQGMDKEAMESLEQFAIGSIRFAEKGFLVRGDSYFDRIEHYAERNDAYITAPKNAELVLASVRQNLEHPVFAKYQDTQIMKTMKRRVETWHR